MSLHFPLGPTLLEAETKEVPRWKTRRKPIPDHMIFMEEFSKTSARTRFFVYDTISARTAGEIPVFVVGRRSSERKKVGRTD